jgi:hypothetical protein
VALSQIFGGGQNEMPKIYAKALKLFRETPNNPQMVFGLVS